MSSLQKKMTSLTAGNVASASLLRSLGITTSPVDVGSGSARDPQNDPGLAFRPQLG